MFVVEMGREGLRLLFCRFAWVMFSSTDACNKAFNAVTKAKINGKELIVDYCGQQSKTYKERMTSAKGKSLSNS